MLIETQNRNLKFFWINKLENWIRDSNLFDKVSDKNWKVNLWSKTTIEEIEEYGLKIFNQTWGYVYATNVDMALASGEKNKYLEAKSKDDKERKKLNELEDKRKKLEESINNYETDIKSIIGSNELTDWNKKVVKADIKDKNILDLQKKVTDLTKLKEEAEKQLKEKQDQILNHRCDTPNNDELNKTKEELDKANKEITSLKEELEKKPHNPNPLPNSPNDKEEEPENNNLNLEQLKEKLTAKRQEIENLKKELEKSKQNSSYSKQSNNQNSKFLPGMATGLAIMVMIGGIIYFARIYLAKKKKKNSERDLVVEVSNGKLNWFKF